MISSKRKKQILLDAEKIITKYKNSNREGRLYRKISKTYTDYKNDDYHDSITDRLYLDKLEKMIFKFYRNDNKRIQTASIVILSIVTIITGYFITDYIDRLSKSNNKVIELTSTYKKIFFGSKEEYLLINFSDFEDLVLTREKSKVTVNLKSTSSSIVDYSIFVVTDKVTNLKYDIIADSVKYGTNVLNSKNNQVYTGTINPKGSKDITIELWQNENYNVNSQLRLYVDAKTIK